MININEGFISPQERVRQIQHERTNIRQVETGGQYHQRLCRPMGHNERIQRRYKFIKKYKIRSKDNYSYTSS